MATAKKKNALGSFRSKAEKRFDNRYYDRLNGDDVDVVLELMNQMTDRDEIGGWFLKLTQSSKLLPRWMANNHERIIDVTGYDAERGKELALAYGVQGVLLGWMLRARLEPQVDAAVLVKTITNALMEIKRALPDVQEYVEAQKKRVAAKRPRKSLPSKK